jgi:predicted transcriptional regulator YdeE
MDIFSTAAGLCVAFVPVVLAFAGSLPAGDSGSRVVEQKQFSVVGVKVRTNNSREMTGQGEIPKQWEEFFKEDILGKISGRADSNIVVVYSSYQSDKNGDYDYLIGARVKDASTVPPGMEVKIVPAGKYMVFTTAVGPVSKIVAETWRKIWDLEDKSQLGGTRAYEADFEIYDQRSWDPKNWQVEIYVGMN